MFEAPSDDACPRLGFRGGPLCSDPGFGVGVVVGGCSAGLVELGQTAARGVDLCLRALVSLWVASAAGPLEGRCHLSPGSGASPGIRPNSGAYAARTLPIGVEGPALDAGHIGSEVETGHWESASSRARVLRKITTSPERRQTKLRVRKERPPLCQCGRLLIGAVASPPSALRPFAGVRILTPLLTAAPHPSRFG